MFTADLLRRATNITPFNSLDRVCALCNHRSSAVVLAAHRVLAVMASSGSELHLLFVTSALKARPRSDTLSLQLVNNFSAFYEALAICFVPAPDAVNAPASD